MAPIKKILAFISVITFIFSVSESYAATRTAVSASFADVSSAVSAAASGDTVVVPAGSTKWSSQLTITKAIILVGNGIGSTVITSGTNAIYGNPWIISYNPAAAEASKTFELSGFTFDGVGTSSLICFQAPDPTHPITGLKIHNNRFVNSNSRAVWLTGLEFGVLYSNQFVNNYINIYVGGSDLSGYNYSLSQGGANYPYFEDNTFTGSDGGFVIETGNGGRVAFRHNTISSYGGSGAEVFDAHGWMDSGDGVGTLSYEIYHNTIGITTNTRYFNQRGGKAIVANNTISGASASSDLTEYQSHWYCTSQAYPKNGQVNNSFYWGNSVAPEVQCNSGTDCTNKAGGYCSPVQFDAQFIKLNRDYWTPISGTESKLPATCISGSYYGTTDTDKIFYCQAANTWTLFYTPYQYPHPLRIISPLNPPNGLTKVPST